MVSRRDLRLFRMEQPIVLLVSWQSLAIRPIFTEAISSGCLSSFRIAEIACSCGHCPCGGAAINCLAVTPRNMRTYCTRLSSRRSCSGQRAQSLSRHTCCLAHQGSSSCRCDPRMSQPGALPRAHSSGAAKARAEDDPLLDHLIGAGERGGSCYSACFLVNRRPTAFHAPASTMRMTIQPFLRNASAMAKRPSFCARPPAMSPPMP
jgi:hypothetical protein